MAYQNERNIGFFRLDGWGLPILGVLTIVLALIAIASTSAEATDRGGDEACADEACLEDGDRHHRGFGHRGRHRGWFGRHQRPDPEEAKDHMQYAAGWMLRRLDVEEPVREQIQARLATGFDELHPIVEKHRDSKGVWVEAVFGEAGVDRATLETQRQGAIESADEAMKIVTETLADVAEMLTPEQRAEVAERIRRHHR